MGAARTTIEEQAKCLELANQGMQYRDIAEKLGLSFWSVKRRLSGARKRERLDPELAQRLETEAGITDLAGLHSGWLLKKDGKGSGNSLYFYLGPDQEKIDFVDALMEVLHDIPRLDPIEMVRVSTEDSKSFANWITLADLHVGGDYGNLVLERDFISAADHLVSRLPPATHAVLFELGDLLEANDHKGVTPNSGNPLDVKRGNHLENSMTAVSLVRHLLYRLLETHDTVEAHFIKGNHDPSAYITVMLALSEHFKSNDRIKVVVSDDEFRVIPWGQCAAFPHHGDTLKWEQLKDVFADQFEDAWAKAKAHRHIMTAHFHHDRKRDLVGCVAEHFRTLHRPNAWALSKGLIARGSLTAITVHRDRGEEHRTISNIRNTTATK